MTETHWITKAEGRLGAASLRLLLLNLPDGHYRVTVSDDAAKRTTEQNRLIHAYFTIFAKELNAMQAHGPNRYHWTMEDMKEWALSKFAPTKQVVDPNGEVHERRKRSHEMDVHECSAFVDTLCAYMRETFGILIPEPNEQTELL